MKFFQTADPGCLRRFHRLILGQSPGQQEANSPPVSRFVCESELSSVHGSRMNAPRGGAKVCYRKAHDV
jgi:hypothetical protein